MKAFCDTIQRDVDAMMKDRGGIDPREDSRAFGASIEKRVVDAWTTICRAHAWTAEERPGRRTLYDVPCVVHGVRRGLDVKTTDADAGKYTDGGVCSVDNLLRFLAGRDAAARGELVVLEVTHARLDGASDRRGVCAVVAAPLHALPIAEIRIENLGTGQVRLNRPLRNVASEVVWDRPITDFLRDFVELARAHYERVADDASRRRTHLDAFARAGYAGFVATRGVR